MIAAPPIHRHLTSGEICRIDARLVQLVAGAHASGSGLITQLLWRLIPAATLYGAVFGWWRAPIQAAYSAIKFPLLFLAITVTSTLINMMLAQVLGARFSLRTTATIILTGMTTTALILGSLSPVLAFLLVQWAGQSTDSVSTSVAMHMYYRLLLLHIALIGAAGLAGNLHMYTLLKTLLGSKGRACRVLTAWLIVIGFAGCQLSWMFSPFICKPTIEPHIFPREYFQQNFYERTWDAVRTM